MSLLAVAREYLARGWNVVPIGDRKSPHHVLIQTGHWQRGTNGRKSPRWRDFQTERVTDELLQIWFAPQHRVPGLGAVTGEISNLVVLDFDGAPGRALHHTLGLPPNSLSGSGSPHLYFPWPGHRVGNKASSSQSAPPFPGLDVRGDGGLIVLPPSQLSNGTYRLLDHQPHEVTQLPEAVARWTGLVREEAPELPVWEAPTGVSPGVEELLATAMQRVRDGGGRDNTGYWLACQLLEHGSRQDALLIMEQYAERVPAHDTQGRHDPYTSADARRNLHSAAKRGPARSVRAWVKPAERDPLDALRACLPGLSAEERERAARLVAGAYVREGIEVVTRHLSALQLDSTAATWVVERQEAQYSVPGMPALRRFVADRA
ncbi:bifunctional DNA primase/polymerase [Deinococcus sp. Leaf326]|uniref:bifunctional DNA primase/polymerase n=1 Tax=Deinococcus sp. Leaf326 TaxID=1736338 RepID=UPI0006F97A64|nr:bifunctional DNA primase/polymerase [Deinococcus sp. Leaf326]KQR21876.1 hypothetical protein ASF71_19415 [Deinococcus sp. Leaf326]